MRPLLLTLILNTVLVGCAIFGSDEAPDEMSPTELLSAPETVVVDGHELALRTYLWRDFMPISPPDGRSLTAIFWIFSADSSPLPDGLSADAAWVVNGDRVWATSLDDQKPQERLAYQLERVARNGPKWSPGVKVHAVVRLREANGETHLLRASGQAIERTD